MHHQKEFKKHTGLQSKYGSNAYMLRVLGLYLDESDLDALAARSLTDGGNDKCLDFIEIDKTGQKIVVAQGYFSEKSADKAPAKKAFDLHGMSARTQGRRQSFLSPSPWAGESISPPDRPDRADALVD